METSNQKLLAAIKMNNKDVHYLDLYITKKGLDYRLSVYRGDFKDFILENPKWYEIAKDGLAEHQRQLGDETFGCGGYSVGVEDIADDLSYNFLTDLDLQKDFAAYFELCDDDLVEVGV